MLGRKKKHTAPARPDLWSNPSLSSAGSLAPLGAWEDVQDTTHRVHADPRAGTVDPLAPTLAPSVLPPRHPGASTLGREAAAHPIAIGGPLDIEDLSAQRVLHKLQEKMRRTQSKG